MWSKIRPYVVFDPVLYSIYGVIVLLLAVGVGLMWSVQSHISQDFEKLDARKAACHAKGGVQLNVEFGVGCISKKALL